MMNGISLKDYAEQKNISYEAVRKQVVRYADELEGHLIKDGRQRYLDAEAVAFLDAKRQKGVVEVVRLDKDKLIEQLKDEKEALSMRLSGVQKDWLYERNKLQSLLNEQKEQIVYLEGELSLVMSELAEAERNEQRAFKELEFKQKQFEDEKHLMQQEIERLRNRKWWQLLFKK